MFLSGDDLLMHAQRLALARGEPLRSLADYVVERKVIDLAAARQRLRPPPEPGTVYAYHEPESA